MLRRNDVHDFTAGSITWTLERDAGCKRIAIGFRNSYRTLEAAKAACLNFGQRCGAIIEMTCAREFFFLCESKVTQYDKDDIRIGSCVQRLLHEKFPGKSE